MKESYPPLNLPQANLKISKTGADFFVWCVVRKKNLLLTPEEWVRQHAVHFLIYQKEVPLGRIASEYLLNINGYKRRCDILVVDEFGKPQLIVECKATSILIDEKTFLQTSNYVKETGSRYFWMTNGLAHSVVDCNNPSEFLEELPEFK